MGHISTQDGFVLPIDEHFDLAQIVSGLAHEMGTPLSVIAATSELLMVELSEDSPQRKDLNAVLEETDRVAGMVRALLQLARPLNPIPDSVNLQEVVSGVSAELEENPAHEEVGCSFELPDDLQRVFVDEALLRQALYNIFDNAMKAAGAGGTVAVAARDHGDAVAITVDDSGRGIPSGDHERVFDPFYRTQTIWGGIGLGLAIARRFLRAFGGDVTASSAPTGGARFTVELPVEGA
jgi:signal transduction histidine kinase